MYTSAVRTMGRSHWAISWMHWAAESARWSNCPGRYSVAKDHALVLRQFVVDVVQLRLGKDAAPRLLEQRRIQSLHVVAVEQPQSGQIGHAEEGARVLEQRAGLRCQSRAFFPTNRRSTMVSLHFQRPLADVRAHEHAVEMYPAGGVIGAVDGGLERAARGRYAQHAAAAGDRVCPSFCGGAAVEHPRVIKRVRAAQIDGLALFIGFGVAARGEDDAAGCAVLEAHVDLRKALLFHGAHDGQKVGVQKRQHHLRLRVAKSGSCIR